MEKINVVFSDGHVEEYKKGTKLIDIAEKHKHKYKYDILIAKVDNDLTELTETLNKNCKVEFLTLESYEARRIYTRGLSFVLIRAAAEILPGCNVSIEHSINKGIYGEIHNVDKFDENTVEIIKKRMKEIIEEDVPFERQEIPIDEAIEVFEKNKQKDRLRLLKYWKKDSVYVYKCGSIYDYFYGNMVPSTGYLKMFDLIYYKPGFLLKFPSMDDPNSMPAFEDQKKLFSVFREAEKWAKILDVADVGALNEKVHKEEIGDIIRVSEALHEKKIAYIADMITDKKDDVKIVLISGPSSSGKTTFSKRLSVQLRVNGLKPHTISLDDYFVEREKTPRHENGDYDFESIYALDLELLNEHMNKLLNGEEVHIPKFNFVTGKREYNGNILKMTDDFILIAEGIHGLNEMLTSKIPSENKFKIYVSALTQLNIDNHNRIPTTDVRLLRRIVRDNRTRGKSAEETLLGWLSVRKGEDKNIFPFQEDSDIMFNSTLVYELGVLKKHAEPLLREIDKTSSAYSEAKRLLQFLEYFLPSEENEIPQNSIIREFIGGSCFNVD